MSANKLLQQYEQYVRTLRKNDGSEYGPAYAKDKLSRLRRILDTLGTGAVANVGEHNFFKLCDALIYEFNKKKYITQSNRRKYGDYLVVVRQLYEMNTGQPAPRYVYYAGVRR